MQDLILKIAKIFIFRHLSAKNSAALLTEDGAAALIQVFSWNTVPQLRQVIEILPLPRGTRRVWEQVGHLK